MSEITRAVIGMPFEMAMESDLSRRQFHSRAQNLLAELKQAEEDNVTWKGGISALGEALKKLTFCARTVTDGPDEALMHACDAAENALSLGGVSRAIDYVEELEAERVQLKKENACLLEKYEAARDRKRSITLLQIQRDQLLEALQEMEIGSGTSPCANKKYKKARQAIAFATGKVKS
ncbi:hypothetical protein [Pseudomonas syringae]|uniref:hypothetical protein n=1 Tax=Pseudomonas syringae TaxID=317 RepID=UPI000E31B3BB|nr:hypothetical protein [Pseudomonas syringae]